MYLYLLRLTNTRLFKIGVSKSPCGRHTQLSRGYPIEIVGVWPDLSFMERVLHRLFAAQRVRSEDVPENGSTEWFRLTPGDVKTLKAECTLARMKQEHKPCRL